MLKTSVIKTRNINPLTDFLRNSKVHIARLKETRTPEILTVNGKAEIVVQDAVSYQEMLDELEQARFLAAVREGLNDLDAGRTHSMAEVKAEMKTKYGF